MLLSIPSLLAQVPTQSIYVNPFKILTVVVLTLGWAAIVTWVDRDTDLVKTKREQWNLMLAAGSLVAFLALFAVPWTGTGMFFAGIGLWVLLIGGVAIAYVVHRNGRVVPQARVMTIDHFKRLLSGGGKDQKQIKDRGQRVRVAGPDGKWANRPEDAEQYEDYQAAQDFLHDALWRRASDVELLAGKEKYRVVYRIDGVGSERDPLPVEDGDRVFRYLKSLAGLNPQEIRRPQSGKIKIALLTQDGDVGYTEVNTSGTTAGERMRLRVETASKVFRIPDLGLAAPRLEQLKELISRPTGLVLLSSPPHHGLTTTQYAVLRAHDAYIQNIHALERRSLMDIDNVTQTIYEGDNSDVNYARKLQTVLRREPDVVLVSDCEDRETAAISTRGAADDRKIYLGINANDSFEALSKYLELLGDNKLASKALLGVLNQRLIRKLCTECREAIKPDPAHLKKMNVPPDKVDRIYRPPTGPILDKKGNEIICPSCQGSGYVGRTGVFELLVVDDAVRELIAGGAPVDRIKNQCRKNRMLYLEEEAFLKVIEGVIDVKELIRAVRQSVG